MIKTIRRRIIPLSILVGLLLVAAPLGTLADSNHTATRVPIAFTSTVVEEISPGEFWVDEDGVFHIRDIIASEDVTGDINGTLISTSNVDFFPPGECTQDSCPGYAEEWGTASITDDTGTWGASWLANYSDVPGNEYEFSSFIMRGADGNADKSFVGSFSEFGDTSATVEGVMMTMATPLQGLNVNTQLCFDEDFNAIGGFTSTGAIESSGGVGVQVLTTAGENVQASARFNLFGALTLVDSDGTATIAFGGDGMEWTDVNAHTWGIFTIADGTGAYSELFGQGRYVASLRPNNYCASGLGFSVNFIGVAHYNEAY